VGDRIFAALGKSAQEALAQADQPGFRAVNLPKLRIQARIRSGISAMDTRNVVARLPGSDPRLKEEAVLYTAHWDHLGIGTPVDGDAIYNGAVDNATGCGILLETARAYTTYPVRPKRSIIFAAVGAEEGGLRGSEYYGKNPPLPAGKHAVNLNYDGEYVWGRTLDVTLVGYERTTLKPLVDQVAQQFQLKIMPDPQPEQGHYYRSDHFSLARVGIPAFSVSQGDQYAGKPPDWGKKAFQEYNEKHYHQPSDEFDPTWDFSGLAQLAAFGFEIGVRVANQAELPTWRAGDEFLPAREKSQRP
jgi:Zn-dependent M28 family amino/carboxypeptidase